MLIRPLDKSTDMVGLEKCVIEIQNFEKKIVPTRPSGESICTEYILELFEKCDMYSGYILVALVNESVVGYASVFTRMVSEDIIEGDQEFAQIGDLVVLADHRGKGIGRMLMKELQSLAETKGASVLKIGVLRQNETAVGLYRSLGFEVISLELQKSI